MNPSGFERSVLWCIMQHLFNLVMRLISRLWCLGSSFDRRWHWWFALGGSSGLRLVTTFLGFCCFSLCVQALAGQGAEATEEKRETLSPLARNTSGTFWNNWVHLIRMTWRIHIHWIPLDIDIIGFIWPQGHSEPKSWCFGGWHALGHVPGADAA